MTIPGRTTNFPIGLGGGIDNDYRDYVSSTQVDSFKIKIDGDGTDTSQTTVSWPANLNQYGTAWTIKPQTGSDWPSVNMLTATSVVIPSGGTKNIIIIKVGATGTNDVKIINNELPTTFVLNQNFQNPFNPSTEIHFSIPVAGKTILTIYNILGQETATLLSEVKNAGNYSVKVRSEQCSQWYLFLSIGVLRSLRS